MFFQHSSGYLCYPKILPLIKQPALLNDPQFSKGINVNQLVSTEGIILNKPTPHFGNFQQLFTEKITQPPKELQHINDFQLQQLSVFGLRSKNLLQGKVVVVPMLESIQSENVNNCYLPNIIFSDSKPHFLRDTVYRALTTELMLTQKNQPHLS